MDFKSFFFTPLPLTQTAGGRQNSPSTLLVSALPHFPARPYELMARKQPRGPPQPPGPPFPSLAPLAAPRPPGLAPRPGAAAAHTVELDARASPVPCNDRRRAGAAAAPVQGDPRLGGLHRHRRPPRTNAAQCELPAQHLSVSAAACPGAQPPRAASVGSPSAADKAAALPASGNCVPRARRSAEPRAEEATHISLQRDSS